MSAPAGGRAAWRRVRAMVLKEWLELRRNRMVLSVIVFVPLLMVAIPVAMLAVMSRIGVSQSDMDEMAAMMDNPAFAGMPPAEAMQAAMAGSFLVLFLMMPLVVPVTIAAYSIVGEKVARSLEPLLATPIGTAELLLAKGLASAIPGVVTAWIAYIAFLGAARLATTSDRVWSTFVHPMWLVAMFVLAPLCTVLAVNVGVIVSSRTNDPRVAEQLGGLLVLPLMALFIGPMAGIVQLSPTVFWITSALVLLVDAILVVVGARLFRRETILTRWK